MAKTLAIIQRQFAQAISIGAPAYNKGDIEKCSNTYDDAITQAVMLCEKDPQLCELTQMLQKSLNEGRHMNSIDKRAWLYRHTMDTALEWDSTIPFKITVIQRFFTQAISKGAPAYNKGEIAKCANIYESVLESALSQVVQEKSLENIAESIKTTLEEGKNNPSVDKRAWAYRHCMDAILDWEPEIPQIVKEIQLKISKTIKQGAPAYNKGEITKCSDLYESCIVESIEIIDKTTSTSAAAAAEEKKALKKVHELLKKTLNDGRAIESVDQRAWLFRHTFDTILQFQIDAAVISIALLKRMQRLLSRAISKAVPSYNSGDFTKCFEIYEQAMCECAALCKDDKHLCQVYDSLTSAIQEGKNPVMESKKRQIYGAAIDDVLNWDEPLVDDPDEVDVEEMFGDVKNAAKN